MSPVLLLTTISHLCDTLFENQNDPPTEHLFRNYLPALLAILHFILLPVSIWTLTNQPFSVIEKTALFLGYALYFAHVSNVVGHELIHRTNTLHFNMGKWLFISILFGHHTSAHRLVHHRYAATALDPNTAHYGESFYSFYARAWRGSFRAGLTAEKKRLGHPKDSRAIRPSNPYFTYILGGFVLIALVAIYGGGTALALYLLMAFFRQTGLLLTDYTQHYGSI